MIRLQQLYTHMYTYMYTHTHTHTHTHVFAGVSAGCYACNSASTAQMSAADLLDKIGWPKSMSLRHDLEIPWPDGRVVRGCLAVFPCGGGLVSVEEGPLQFRHLLLTQSAVVRLPAAGARV